MVPPIPGDNRVPPVRIGRPDHAQERETRDPLPARGGQKRRQVSDLSDSNSPSGNKLPHCPFDRFGMLAPMLVQMERQIDREIAADQKKLGNGVGEGNQDQNGMEEDSDSELEDEQPVLMYGPLPQIVTNDLKSLDEMVSRRESEPYTVFCALWKLGPFSLTQSRLFHYQEKSPRYFWPRPPSRKMPCVTIQIIMTR